MTLATTILIAFAMSTDAFAAAIGKGSALYRPRFSEALRAGVIFGVIEAITPIVGWLLGSAAAEYITGWNHWVAFGLLSCLGLHMIKNGCSAQEEAETRPSTHSFWVLAVTGFATSIDAMAVGLGLAFVDADILRIAAAIGLATMIMVTIGIMLGRVVGAIVGQRAEILGGLILIGIGAAILADSMGYLSFSLSLQSLAE